MLTKEQVTDILNKTGVLLNGHFLLTSGRHSDRYMQCAKLFQYPEYSELVCKSLAEGFSDEKVDLVIGPAIGGIIIAYELARQLDAKAIFAEREDGVMTLRRGFEIPAVARVVVAEDVTTTGGSVKEVIELVKQSQAELAGVAVVVDRSNGNVDFGTKLCAAIAMDIPSYEPSECPLCKDGIPVVKPGSRKFRV
ncbi:MAG: orotate phosphoribosyltransferase [Clostridiales bacterium]|nr:orotate phosphoribosyltransferase [Clostridiales bacterium]MDK2991571.1 orotate phosphoribosyltransferase [Clostridiales bacterium]